MDTFSAISISEIYYSLLCNAVPLPVLPPLLERLLCRMLAFLIACVLCFTATLLTRLHSKTLALLLASAFCVSLRVLFQPYNGAENL